MVYLKVNYHFSSALYPNCSCHLKWTIESLDLFNLWLQALIYVEECSRVELMKL